MSLRKVYLSSSVRSTPDAQPFLQNPLKRSPKDLPPSKVDATIHTHLETSPHVRSVFPAKTAPPCEANDMDHEETGRTAGGGAKEAEARVEAEAKGESPTNLRRRAGAEPEGKQGHGLAESTTATPTPSAAPTRKQPQHPSTNSSGTIPEQPLDFQYHTTP
jgi:hypothetical protein